MPIWMGLLFQDSTSFNMENIIFFHDFSMILVIYISFLSGYFIFSCIFSSNFNSFLMESEGLEIVWTILPTLVLVFLAVPSMQVLYTSEETFLPSFTIKTSGHQWYWSYDPESTEESFDVFMEPSLICRLLKTNSILVLPVFSSVRNLVTSTDVVHSWSVPSMGMKVDAVPGRLSQVFVNSNSSCIVTGQCSEICGANHSFMPIALMFC